MSGEQKVATYAHTSGGSYPLAFLKFEKKSEASRMFTIHLPSD